MIIHCPKCGYSRKPTDSTPKGECPACGVVFAEFLSVSSHGPKPSPDGLIASARTPKAVPAMEAAPDHRNQRTKLLKDQTTACPACIGTVAFGVKACPHCGREDPAPLPQPAKKAKSPRQRNLLIALGAAFLIFSAVMSRDGGNQQSTPAVSNVTPAVLHTVQAAVKNAGFRCDSLSGVVPHVFASGYRVTCNDHRYAYSIDDRGGRWVVTVD